MGYKFVRKKRWIREGIISLLYVLIIAFLGSYLFLTSNTNNFINIILIVFIIAAIYRAIYYFKLPKQYYLIIETDSLSIYRGNILPRKLILFNKVERIVQMNEVITFIMDDGKEQQVYTDFLSNENKLALKKILHLKFASESVGF